MNNIRTRIRANHQATIARANERSRRAAIRRCDPLPPPEEETERWFEAQRDMSPLRRSRGWWIEEGIPVFIVGAAAVSALGAIVLWLLSLL